MSISPEEVHRAIGELGLACNQAFEAGSVVWDLDLKPRAHLRIELAGEVNLLQATSSALAQPSLLTEEDRIRLYSAVLHRNALLLIGHYELNEKGLRYRATLPLEESDISDDLLQRWIRSAVAATSSFQMCLALNSQ